MPPKNKETDWVYSFENGQEEHCKAEWGNVTFNGNRFKCIKIIRSTYVNGECLDQKTGYRNIEYYVSNFGFAKSQVLKLIEKKVMPFYNFAKKYKSNYEKQR
jgi:hypothetical protein